MLFVVAAAIVVVQFSCNLHLFIFAFINKQRERVVVVINIAHTDIHADRGADSARYSETARRETWEHGRRLGEAEQSGGGKGDWETGKRHAQIYLYLANFQRLLTKLSTKCNAKRNKIVQEAEPIEAAATRERGGKGGTKGGGTANKVAACVTGKKKEKEGMGCHTKEMAK